MELKPGSGIGEGPPNAADPLSFRATLVARLAETAVPTRPLKGWGFAARILVSIVALAGAAILIAVLLPLFISSREWERARGCAGHLKELGLAMIRVCFISVGDYQPSARRLKSRANKSAKSAYAD